MEYFKNSVWDYFDKCISSDDQKRAQCTFCKNIYSYAATSGNLRSHLEKMHGKQFDRQRKSVGKGKEEEMSKNSKIWIIKYSQHYTKFDKELELATCNYCLGQYSYRNTTNLGKHILKKHADIYKKYFAKATDWSDCNEVTDETFFNINDEESNDANKYIEKESDVEACDVTDTTILKEDNEDGDMFTEVVYLDEDPDNTPRKNSTRSKSKTVKTRKVKARKFSSDNRTTRNESNHRSRTSFAESDDEIDNFGKYIVSLLKKMPTNVSRNIQRNVINMILNTEFENGIQQNAVTSDASNSISIQIKPVGTGPVDYIL